MRRCDLVALGVLLACGFVVPATCPAEVIFYDTFDVGASPTPGNDVDDPADIAWTSGTHSVVDDSGSIGSGNALEVQGGAWTRAAADYADFTLGVGELATFGFRARFMGSGSADTNGAGFRFGLYRGSDDHGYFAQIGTGTSTSAVIFEDNIGGNDPGGGADGGTTLASTTTGVYDGFNIGDVLDLSITLARTGTDSGEVSVTIVDGANTFTQTAAVASAFLADYSRLVIRKGSVSQWFRFDDARLEVVPEPSTLALAVTALLGMALLGWRRRR